MSNRLFETGSTDSTRNLAVEEALLLMVDDPRPALFL
jgi:hypothetical protein